jgi:hypothetical protein
MRYSSTRTASHEVRTGYCWCAFVSKPLVQSGIGVAGLSSPVAGILFWVAGISLPKIGHAYVGVQAVRGKVAWEE